MDKFFLFIKEKEKKTKTTTTTITIIIITFSKYMIKKEEEKNHPDKQCIKN